MATNRDLLKEAIADAKAVKEMAIANAKTALEEAFTPRLKEMLSAKIQEMEYEEDDVKEMMYDEDDDSKKMEEEMKYDEDDSKKMEEEMMYDEDDSKKMEEEMMYDEDDSKKMEESIDEMNLEELLAELEEEEKGEVDEGKKSDDKDDVKEGMYMEDDDDMDDMDMDGEGEPLDLEDMTDEDLKKMIEDVIADMIESGELEAGEGAEDDMDEEGEEMEMSDEEEVDLTELLKEIEEEMKYEEDDSKKSMKEEEIEEGVMFGLDSSPDQVAGMIAAMIPFVSAATGIAVAAIRSKLSKAKSPKEVVDIANDLKDNVKKDNMSEEIAELQAENKSLKSDLNEAVKETNATNLLNAKLLYTNKIFKGKNLNESQKVKVLSSFDKANTTKEAKLIYETLNEGLKVKKSTIKENLGRASKATTIPTTKKPIVESNEVFARMQKLAGIIK